MDEKKVFPCKNCGGELVFSPDIKKMVCPYCNSTFEIENDKNFNPEEKEIDLLEFLEKSPDAKGYEIILYQFECKNCGAKISSPEKRRDVNCPFCGTQYVGEAKESEGLIKPAGIIPFEIARKKALSDFADWVKRGWFRPNDLKKLYKLEQIQGIYLPFFTFDAKAKSYWSALAGYYYNVEESVPVIRNGKKIYETRQVRKIRWEPVSGEREDFFNDVLVPAIFSERLTLLYNIFPYNIMVGLKPYDPNYLAGFGVFNSEMPLKEVYSIAKAQIEQEEIRRCSSDVPGDTQKDLRVKTNLTEQTFKHILAPVWSGSFKYKNKTYPFLINGQTGKVYGKKPYSFWKIFFTVAALVILAIIVLLLLSFFGGNN
ncbi:MAG: hypothetical protein GYA35_01140 [Thermoanaerobaculaceae bacterium]|nr:hypothetical protein [Thermoanaerobaculaceae bacterium]